MGNHCCKAEEVITTPEQIDKFMSNVRPLDLIVFRGGEGVSTMITKLEKLKTGSEEVSHVEVAITREWCKKIKEIRAMTNVADTDQTLFSWGSTLSGPINDGVYNAETGGVNFGVQVRVLRDLVCEYLKNPGANVGVCRLIDNPTERRDGESDTKYLKRVSALKKKISLAYTTYQGRNYDANFLALFSSLFPSLRPLRTASEKVLSRFCQANSWLFCSEFAAVLYEAVGVIDDSTDGVLDGNIPDPRNIVPVDFLGVDADPDGIVKPICQVPPIWIKPTKSVKSAKLTKK